MLCLEFRGSSEGLNARSMFQNMERPCEGDGRCLVKQPNGAYKRRHCPYLCTPAKCKKCGDKLPEWVLLDWDGKCIHCGTHPPPEIT